MRGAEDTASASARGALGGAGGALGAGAREPRAARAGDGERGVGAEACRRRRGLAAGRPVAAPHPRAAAPSPVARARWRRAALLPLPTAPRPAPAPPRAGAAGSDGSGPCHVEEGIGGRDCRGAEGPRARSGVPGTRLALGGFGATGGEPAFPSAL